MSLEERTTQLEQAFAMLVKLTQSMDERMDTQLSWINQLGEAQAQLSEAQANSEAKIAALADAQIKTESVVAALAERMSELAAAQAHTDKRLDALIDIVGEGRGGNSQG